jgi:two-component system cell cycle sensor histidine kinase/response regulator CckA
VAIPLRVLIVEDSEDDTLLLVHALKQGGYKPVFERVETPEAMDSLLSQKEWDIIIADYSMPRFSAPEALETLKSKQMDIPFIIVSGAIGEEMAVSAMKAGAHDFVMKDNFARLIPAIARELREAKNRQQRRLAEEEKNKMKAQLLQAQKMEAIGRLTGGVAHDFNNLLTAIRGYSDMALLQSTPDSAIYKDLTEIQSAAERAMNLTRQLLLFSRRQPMKFISLDLNKTIEDLLGILHRLIGEDIEVHYDLVPDTLSVYADQVSVEQMIVNLMVNAKDAMPEGGKITIRTEKIKLNDQAVQDMPEGRPGQFIRFSVIDTGIGMDPEIQEHIFEPFFSTKEFGKGSGLGLSVVYGIIQEHKGWIRVVSEVHKGSTFEIYLPYFPEQPRIENESIREISLDKYQGKGERILLIEDEDDLRRFTERALNRCGYVVYAAADHKEAMNIFKKEKGQFQLIFSDVVLPDINGIKLAEKFLSLNPDIQVLLTSGYIDQKAQWQLIKDKGYPFLQKPYTMIHLLTAIRKAIEKND